MLLAQGFNFDGKVKIISNNNIKSEISENLIPKCPECGGEIDFNLRKGNNFIQDEGLYEHQTLYTNFIYKYKNEDILYIELYVGYNTSSIIKYNFWNKVAENKKAKFIEMFHKKKEYEKELEKRKEKELEKKNEEDDKIYEEEQKQLEDNNKKMEEMKLLGKKVKRSKIQNFKNLSQCISSTKEENPEISKNL